MAKLIYNGIDLNPALEFAYKVARAMKELGSSHVYFLMQQAYEGDPPKFELGYDECEVMWKGITEAIDNCGILNESRAIGALKIKPGYSEIYNEIDEFLRTGVTGLEGYKISFQGDCFFIELETYLAIRLNSYSLGSLKEKIKAGLEAKIPAEWKSMVTLDGETFHLTIL